MLTYAHGNNVGNFHFIWKVPDYSDSAISCSMTTVDKVKEQIPEFHNRGIRRALITKYGRVAPNIKPAIVRSFYRNLTGDASSPLNGDQASVDERVQVLLDMEDPNVVIHLREINTGHRGKYDAFWSECMAFLQDVGTPADDRRHGTILIWHVLFQSVTSGNKSRTDVRSESLSHQNHGCDCNLAKVITFPSENLLRGPVRGKIHGSSSAVSETSPGCALCLLHLVFRYQREFVIKFRDQSSFVSLDDKHPLKV